jgi:hypothetical protein
MQTYREYRPTQFDTPGLALEDQQEWLVLPVIQTRDSEPLEQSNFAKALEMMDGESDTVEVHRFGHWGPGWFEIIIVNPADTARVAIAEDIESSLADYPVLDESDFSAREWEEYQNSWRNGAASDMRHFVFKAFEISALPHVADLMYDADPEDWQALYEASEPNETYNSDCWPYTERAVRRLTVPQIAAWVRTLRAKQRAA